MELRIHMGCRWVWMSRMWTDQFITIFHKSQIRSNNSIKGRNRRFIKMQMTKEFDFLCRKIYNTP